jgi:outer membrane receptor protein involved in Fe transport
MGLQFAHAQSADQELEEVLVTGSRIVRRDYTANSPIQTVNSDSFENQSSISLETALNDLPQFVPAATGMTQIQDQAQFTDNNPTITSGAATISLRGLGPNRNLVLLDGYRAVPANATMAVDVNSIPSAAIDRVEVITGGASSVYGADAVAGVVNFILKRDFEGVDLDLQYGNMMNGEGPEARASALFGINSADGRGNIMLGLEWAKRAAIHADDTDFWNNAFRDPTVEGTNRIPTFPYYNINSSNPPGGATIDGIFDQVAPNVILRNAGGAVQGRVYLNNDGTVFTGGESFNNVSPAGAGSTAGTYRYNGLYNTARNNYLVPGDFPFVKVDAEGQLSQHFLDFEANVPLDRNSVFGRAEYALSDKISAYAQILGVNSETRRLWTQSPATGGWGLTAPYGNEIYAPSLNQDGSTNIGYLPGGQFGLDCEADNVPGCTESEAWPVPPELAMLLDSRSDPNEDWSFNYTLDFPHVGAPGAEFRSIYSESRTYQSSFGLRGDIDAIDGTWDLITSRGKSKVDVLYRGHASLERIRTVFTRSPNWGHGYFQQGNAAPPGNGFSGGIATCTSGMPAFRPHNEVTEDCLEAIYVKMNHQSEMDQKFVEANLQGHLMDLPAGEARFSAGYHSRENSYYYIVDPLQTQESVLDNALQFPASGSEGVTSVEEVYGELLLPLLRDKPGVQHLDLELGYRYSDYKYQGGVDTYKVLIDWGITDTLRFRGGRQLATRAPNIAEMFQAETQNFSNQSIGDPCGLNSNAPYGANSAVNPNYQQTIDICSERMGAIAAEFYAPGTLQPNGNAWNAFYNVTGNPNVNPETAETYTAGFVFTPNSGRELWDGLTATIDWYQIEVEDMIAAESVLVVYEECLSVASNPTGDTLTPACLRLNRNPGSGGAAPATVGYVNAAFAKVSGVDLTLDWRANLAGGNFGVNFMVTALQNLKTQASSDAPVIDWKGSLGPDPGTSLNNGAYDFRTFTTVNYGRNDWNVSLRWRYLPDAIDASQAVTPLSTQLGAEDSYNVFDLTGTWAVSDQTKFRFGVENLFDEPPVWTGARTAADNSPSSGSGTTEAGFYDILGRTFFVGVNASF